MNGLLGVSSFECTISVFNVAEKTIDELKNLLELKSLELHVEEVRKKGNKKNRR